ncbi:hypothetical protein ACVWZ4_002493 [Bradyrhizobium sp. USDA 4472]
MRVRGIVQQHDHRSYEGAFHDIVHLHLKLREKDHILRLLSCAELRLAIHVLDRREISFKGVCKIILGAASEADLNCPCEARLTPLQSMLDICLLAPPIEATSGDIAVATASHC